MNIIRIQFITTDYITYNYAIQIKLLTIYYTVLIMLRRNNSYNYIIL